MKMWPDFLQIFPGNIFLPPSSPSCPRPPLQVQDYWPHCQAAASWAWRTSWSCHCRSPHCGHCLSCGQTLSQYQTSGTRPGGTSHQQSGAWDWSFQVQKHLSQQWSVLYMNFWSNFMRSNLSHTSDLKCWGWPKNLLQLFLFDRDAASEN